MTISVGSSQKPNATFASQNNIAALLKKPTSSAAPQQRNTEAAPAGKKQESVHLESVLTRNDKQVLNYAVGGVELTGADGMKKLNFMAIRIALDRSTGALSGEIDIAYMQRIAQSQKITGDNSIASSSIARAIEFLDRKKVS